MADEKMNWPALFKKHCPQCGAALMKSLKGWECSNQVSLIPRKFSDLSCRYFITTERLEQIIKNHKNSKYGKRK